MDTFSHSRVVAPIAVLLRSALMGVLFLVAISVRAEDQPTTQGVSNGVDQKSDPVQAASADRDPGVGGSTNPVPADTVESSNPASGSPPPSPLPENPQMAGSTPTPQPAVPSPSPAISIQSDTAPPGASPTTTPLAGMADQPASVEAKPEIQSTNQPAHAQSTGSEVSSQTNRSVGEAAPSVPTVPSQLDLVKLHVIVIKDNPSMAPQAADGEKAGKDLADEIHKKLESGSEFQVLAMMYSQDPSRKYGGNLGWVERRAIKKKLADIAFAMKSGEISDVIPMDHRYLILKVDGMRPAGEVHSAYKMASMPSEPSTGNEPNEGVQKDDLTPRKPTASGMPVDAPPNLEESPEKMASSAPGAPPSENVTVNLITRLVRRGILTKQDAADLIRQANEDAMRASQVAQATQQALSQSAAAQEMATQEAAPPTSDEQVSVSYVPEIVKAEMREEIKRDVMVAAQAEGWNQPNIPEWLSKFRPFMDLRLRYQANEYPSGNSTELFDTMNYNAINTGWPINLMAIPGATPYYNYFGYFQAQNPVGPPTYNTTQQRDLARVRFRFGADMNLGDNFTSGFRIGTGQNGSPVSENQTFGFVGNQGMAQGGNFSSYAIWLDRAFLKYEIGNDPDRMAAITLGRFDNPFYTPTTIMWANDIGFDGIAAQARYKILKGFTPFLSGGIFPIYNTDLNFPASQQPKISSNDKYLYAAQAGIDWKITKDLNFKSALGYYYFQNVQGRVSSPGVTPNQEAQLNTDDTRPTFAQRGNTYIELRNINKVDAYTNGIATGDPHANYINSPTQGVDPYYINQFQYFGLATPFNILSANARLEYRHWEPVVVSLSGEWDQNLAYNQGSILTSGPTPGPENNYNETLISGPVNNINSGGSFNGGNNAWIVQMKVGSGALQKRWDWDFGVSYRYVESDAVIDGFCDSDFGGGGTNLKGWSVGGNLALSRNVFIGLRWLSANGIAGPTYKSDIIQVDVNARF